MARHATVLQAEFPYHITARCINRDWFRLPMDLVWQTMCEELFLTSVLYSLRVHAFVLMTNHFHLIASTPAANIDRCMWYFMGQTSQRLVRSGNRINQTYGGRHFKCVLNSYSYYLNAYKYLYRNPVNAELCTKVEEYKYSSLRGLLGFDRVEFPVYDDLAVDVEKTLPWLNKAPLLQKTEAVRAALRRRHFKARKPSRYRVGVAEDEVI